MKIKSVAAREVLNSKGNPTIEVEINGARAMVPSGVSRGTYEAVELRDGGKRFGGNGVLKAVANVNSAISNKISGRDFTQKELDDFLIKLDGTPNKAKLGANAILGVSMAFCASQGEVHETIANLTKNKKYAMPVPFMNIIEGGKHANNNLALQEFLIVPSHANSFSDALRLGAETYQALKARIQKKYGKNGTNTGDESGFAPPLNRSEEALELIMNTIEELGYESKIKIAIDAAASEFFRDKNYEIDDRTMDKDDLADFYLALSKKYPLVSIEDPFNENDFDSYASLLTKLKGVQVVGDDLTATNMKRIQEAVNKKSCSCLLLKVNQIGTISEALDAAQLAMKNGWHVMVSHRAGDTEDTFIADLAVGLGCGQIKSGAPCRSERTAKYNRLLRIEEKLGKVKYGMR